MKVQKRLLCTNSCCPEIEIDSENQQVAIADDYNGCVQLSFEEFEKAWEEYQNVVSGDASDRAAVDAG